MLATRKTRRLSAVALLVVMVAAACTSDAPPRNETSQTQDDTDEGDEVLGAHRRPHGAGLGIEEVQLPRVDDELRRRITALTPDPPPATDRSEEVAGG